MNYSKNKLPTYLYLKHKDLKSFKAFVCILYLCKSSQTFVVIEKEILFLLITLSEMYIVIQVSNFVV